jgi:hypothetical protein
MMLCAAQKPFTLFLYDIAENDSSAWSSDYFAAKGGYIQKYKNPLWNLPFCADRQEKRVICQTNAVFAHVGRECGFMGNDSIAASQCEELLNEIYDLRNVMVKFVYGGPEDGEKDGDLAKEMLSGAMNHLKKLEAYLDLQSASWDTSTSDDKAKGHLVNGKMSAPDFHLFEMLDQFEGLCKYYNLGDLYESLPRLKAFKTAFGSMP